VPLYEYECAKCGKHFEKIEKLQGPYLKKCPNCGGRVVRLMSAPAIQFKGSGWYVTDYGRAPRPGAEKTDGGSAAEKSDSKSESKSESKGESKAESKGESKSESKTETKTASDAKDRKKSGKEK
jgi:putative FmdB family regulatory protein